MDKPTPAREALLKQLADPSNGLTCEASDVYEDGAWYVTASIDSLTDLDALARIIKTANPAPQVSGEITIRGSN